jgi:predicted DNA-binding ribbon-helix-helix protein
MADREHYNAGRNLSIANRDPLAGVEGINPRQQLSVRPDHVAGRSKAQSLIRACGELTAFWRGSYFSELSLRGLAPACSGAFKLTGPMPKSSIPKRTIFFNGKKTSVSLEDEFWNALKEIAEKRGKHLSDLAAAIDEQRERPNLSSALRLFVLDYYKAGIGR